MFRSTNIPQVSSSGLPGALLIAMGISYYAMAFSLVYGIMLYRMYQDTASPHLCQGSAMPLASAIVHGGHRNLTSSEHLLAFLSSPSAHAQNPCLHARILRMGFRCLRRRVRACALPPPPTRTELVKYVGVVGILNLNIGAMFERTFSGIEILCFSDCQDTSSSSLVR